MNKKLVFLVMLVGLMVFSLALVSCGNETSKLAGVWEDDKGHTIEFFSDGTVTFFGMSATWRAENNRLNLSSLGGAISMDYKLSGSTLTITLDGKTEVLKRKK